MADDFGNVVAILRILRESGLGFDDAWAASYPASRPSAERVNVRVALAETREGWRRAFDGEPPTRGESAVTMLVGLLSEANEPEPVGELVGVRCG